MDFCIAANHVEMMATPGSATWICVSNAKGGTGKTTVTINLGGALHARGHDVLLIDLDPQGNATEGLGHASAYDASAPTLFDALLAPAQTDVQELIVGHPEMDLLPSNIKMLHAERELTIAAVAGASADPSPVSESTTPQTAITDDELDTLRQIVAPVASAYDYILIDAPPSYGRLTDLGIAAAGNVLVPALTETTSVRAVELFINQLTALEDQLDRSITEVGLVANRFAGTDENNKMLQWFDTVFHDIPVWTVPDRAVFQRAFAAGESVFAHAPATDAVDAFREMAADIEDQLTQPWPADWQPASETTTARPLSSPHQHQS